MIIMIDDVLEEVLHFWQIFENHCLISSSLCSDCEWCAQSSKDECELMSKQLIYVESKQEYKIQMRL